MPKYTVKRRGLYFRVDGKLRELDIGHELNLTEEQGLRMIKRKFVQAKVDDEPKQVQVEIEVEQTKPKKRKKKAKKKES